jgi:glycosyltransferase involved in cell wall biosynthesis
MSSSPLVTVITSTYNWPDALQEAVKTVLSQTFTDFEYLVIGDCCTDHSEDIVKEFDDPRTKWLNLKENTGNQSGVNKIALQMAKGKYIAYLNHDDLWFPHHLQALISPLRENSLDIVSSLALGIKPPGFNFREIIGSPWKLPDGTISMYPMTSNVMHTRSAANAAGGWIDWRQTHAIPTQDIFLRMRQLRGAFGVVSDITSLKFHSGDRKYSYRTKLATEQSYFAKKIQEDPGFRYREMMKAIAYKQMEVKAPAIPLPDRPEDAPPGWQIEQWRRCRGLAPMLDETDLQVPQDLPEEEVSPVKILANDSTFLLNTPEVESSSPSLARPKNAHSISYSFSWRI